MARGSIFTPRAVGPKTNSQRRAERLTQVLEPEELVRWAQKSRKLITDWHTQVGRPPLLNRDLPQVKELYARYVNCRSEPTIPSLMHWDNEVPFWKSICDRDATGGVKKDRREIRWMRVLICYLAENPYYNADTGELSVPEVPIFIPDNTEERVAALMRFGREFQGGNPLEAVDYISSWYKEYFEDAVR